MVIDLTGLFIMMLSILAAQQDQGLIAFILFLISLATSGDKFTFFFIVTMQSIFWLMPIVLGEVPAGASEVSIVFVLLVILWRTTQAPQPGTGGPEHYAPAAY